MKNLGPGLLLLVLVLGAVAVSGWLYGLHWKKVALGEKFSPIEAQLILFQDQVDLLTEENDELNKEITELIAEKNKANSAK